MGTAFLQVFETHLGANSACQDRGRDSRGMEIKGSLPEYNLGGDRIQLHRNKIPHLVSYALFSSCPSRSWTKSLGKQLTPLFNKLLASKVATFKAGAGEPGLSDTQGYEDECCETAPK